MAPEPLMSLVSFPHFILSSIVLKVIHAGLGLRLRLTMPNFIFRAHAKLVLGPACMCLLAKSLG